MHKLRAILTGIAAGAALAACAQATPRQLMTPVESAKSFGYVDERLAEDRYRISYIGPEVRTRQTVKKWRDKSKKTAETTSYELALWRAAQIAQQTGYRAFTITSAEVDTKYYIVGRDYELNYDPVFQNLMINVPAYESATYYKPEVILEVRLVNELSDDAFDAGETARRLESKYADLGNKSISAHASYYFGPTSFLHDYKSLKKPPAEAAPTERKYEPFVPYHPYGL